MAAFFAQRGLARRAKFEADPLLAGSESRDLQPSLTKPPLFGKLLPISPIFDISDHFEPENDKLG